MGVFKLFFSALLGKKGVVFFPHMSDFFPVLLSPYLGKMPGRGFSSSL